MKKIISMVFFLLFVGGIANAQDLITKKNGEDIQAKILEVNDSDIKYKRWDNLEGPTFTLKKSEILIVRYENGTNEVFKTQDVTRYAVSEYAASGEIQPGMRYKEYKNFYDPRTYTYKPGDRYSPVVGGLCSWIIPGLGQMINGEVGRGFGYLGGAIGAGIFMGIGSAISVAGAEEYMYSDSGEGAMIAGTVMVIAGAAALLAIDICAIVDGVRVAKVKNMYERDTREMANVSIKLEPYFATTAGVGNNNIAAGASLKIKF